MTLPLFFLPAISDHHYHSEAIMEYKQLRYITTIAETGSFTEAANILYVSQPSLSHMVSQVEKQLGVQLFNRSTSPLTLTYAGEIFIRYAEEVLFATNKMEHQIRDIAQGKKGLIRIGIPYERSAYILPKIIPDFHREYPEIRIELADASGSQLLTLLDRGKTDFAVMPVYEHSAEGFEYQRIYTEPLLLSASAGMICSDDLTAPGSDTVSVDRLQNKPFVLQNEKKAIRPVIDHLLEAHRIHPHISQIVSGNTSAYGLSKAGLGIAIIPEVTILLNGSDDSSQFYRMAGLAPTCWDICAVYRKNTYLGSIEKRLIDMIGEACHDHTKMS